MSFISHGILLSLTLSTQPSHFPNTQSLYLTPRLRTFTLMSPIFLPLSKFPPPLHSNPPPLPPSPVPHFFLVLKWNGRRSNLISPSPLVFILICAQVFSVFVKRTKRKKKSVRKLLFFPNTEWDVIFMSYASEC